MAMTIYSSTYGFKAPRDGLHQKLASGGSYLSPARMAASNVIGEASDFRACRDECKALAHGARAIKREFQQGQDIQCGL
jgi:hypothetical protein